MTQENPESNLSFERVVFFSDAVFAIAITLLVLEIKPPHLQELSETALRNGLLHLLPKFTGFIVSFMIGLSAISVMIAPVAFAVIPLIARLLDPARGSLKTKQTREAPGT